MSQQLAKIYDSLAESHDRLGDALDQANGEIADLSARLEEALRWVAERDERIAALEEVLRPFVDYWYVDGAPEPEFPEYDRAAHVFYRRPEQP